MTSTFQILDQLAMRVPIVQAPMAGVSTPAMAAAVANAGALGSIAVGHLDAASARDQIAQLRALTDRPFNVNLFVHAEPVPNEEREAAWIEALAPEFRAVGAEPPARLQTVYRSFAGDDEMLRVLLDLRPAIVSFHFGLPDAVQIPALKAAGCLLLATATSLAEARAARSAGIDAVIAQGYEAGGHRGMFDPGAPDERLGALDLTRVLAAHSGLPAIAAGGIMDGAGIKAALDAGAVAAQLGTAFIGCPESSADAPFRAALFGEAAHHTVMTNVISGRPARCLRNRFTEWGRGNGLPPPPYPIAYDAGKALNAAAKAAGDGGYGAQWAGQGAPAARALPAAALIAALVSEM